MNNNINHLIILFVQGNNEQREDYVEATLDEVVADPPKALFLESKEERISFWRFTTSYTLHIHLFHLPLPPTTTFSTKARAFQREREPRGNDNLSKQTHQNDVCIMRV